MASLVAKEFSIPIRKLCWILNRRERHHIRRTENTNSVAAVARFQFPLVRNGGPRLFPRHASRRSAQVVLFRQVQNVFVQQRGKRRVAPNSPFDNSSSWIDFVVRDQVISKETHIVAANSVSLPATRILTEALRHLRYLILEELTERCSEALSPESISWILTVPAVWSKSTRQLIKEIAVEVS